MKLTTINKPMDTRISFDKIKIGQAFKASSGWIGIKTRFKSGITADNKPVPNAIYWETEDSQDPAYWCETFVDNHHLVQPLASEIVINLAGTE